MNDAAVIAGDTAASITETDAVLNASGQLTVTDVDGAAEFVAQASAVSASGKGTFSIDAKGNWIYASNSADAFDYLAAGVTAEETFTVAAADGTEQVVKVTINGTNDAPVITSINKPTIDENVAPGTMLYTGRAIDVDDDLAALKFSLKVDNNDDAGLLAINETTGEVTLITGSPDYETKSSYTFTVVVTDAAGATNEETVTLSVNDLDDTPPVTPTLALGAGIANGATSAEALQTSGVVMVTAENGATTVVTFANGNNSVSKTITGIGAAQAVVLVTEDLTTLGDGSITVSAIATDAAGNASEAGASSFMLDTLAPTVAISGNVSEVKVGETATITFTFSENPGSSFAAEDVVVTGGALGAISGSGLIRTAVFTPTAGTASGTASITVKVASYTDSAGNTGSAGTTPLISIDTLAPTVTSIVLANMALKAGETSLVTITFSEKVAGFSNADVTVENGTLSTLNSTDEGKAWTGTFTPTVNTEDATNLIKVSAAYTDLAGNAGSAKDSANYVVDTKAPTLTITDNKPDLATGDITFTFEFSEDVFGFSVDDIEVGAGTKGSLAGSGKSYSMVVTAPDTGGGNITVNVAADKVIDLAGNNNVAADQYSQDYYNKGQTVIDLGLSWQLIKPVQVDGGKWYYVVDTNKDGSHDDNDRLTHDYLDGLFNHDINGVVNQSEKNADGNYGTTDIYRYATINGVKLALPTIGLKGPYSYGYKPGTALEGSGDNANYDDLLAIWDAHNGTGTGTAIMGAPAGWGALSYWSATPGGAGHADLYLSVGFVGDLTDYTGDRYVALEVV